LQGDVSALPFPEKTFSSAIAVLVLHHLRSAELQERAFAEVFRVLRPGGVFLAVDIPDGWLNRAMHVGSTFVQVAPAAEPKRLASVGFPEVDIVYRSGAFRLKALRPATDHP
jgi:ubiquinone/menaquinone biosynthesis C-methylase UbiE